MYFKLVCILFVFFSNLQAKGEVEDFNLSTLKSEFSSPFTTDAKYIVYSGAALTTILAFLRTNHHDWIYNDASSDKFLGKSDIYGNILGQWVPNLAYMGYMFGENYFKEDTLSKKRGYLMLKASIYTAMVTTILKYTVSEKRPDGGDMQSFPSGHTSSAFAFASVVAMEHAWYWGLSAYLMAGFVGYSRINDNRHYTHDVVGGAVIGSAIGTGLCLLYQQSKPHDDVAPSGMPIFYWDKDQSFVGYSWPIN